jgi:hypothetical protein
MIEDANPHGVSAESATEARLRATLAAVSILDAPRPRGAEPLPTYASSPEHSAPGRSGRRVLVAAAAVVLLGAGAVVVDHGLDGDGSADAPVAAGPSTGAARSAALTDPVLVGPGIDAAALQISPGPRPDGGSLHADGEGLVLTDFSGTASRTVTFTAADGVEVTTVVIDDSPWSPEVTRAVTGIESSGDATQEAIDVAYAEGTPYAGPSVQVPEAGLSYMLMPETDLAGPAAVGGNGDVTVLVSAQRTDGSAVDLEAVLHDLRLAEPS